MGHYTHQGNKERLEQFIDEQMDDLMIKTDEEKIDMLATLVYGGLIQVDDLIQYCDQEARIYYAEQWKPR